MKTSKGGGVVRRDAREGEKSEIMIEKEEQKKERSRDRQKRKQTKKLAR